MHLYIELNTGLTENVSSSVIKKLYELASGGTLDATSDIKGTLHTTIMSAREKAFLEGMFSDFHVTADEYSLSFEDAEVENICVTNWGSNGAVTLTLLQNVSTIGTAFKNNTNIVSFDEFLYFTGLPANNNWGNFQGCSSLKNITLPNNIRILNSTFQNCTNLETVSNLSRITEVLSGAFNYCSKITSLTFTGLTGKAEIGRNMDLLESVSINEGATDIFLLYCPLLTTIDIPSSAQYVRLKECANLTTVTFALNSHLIGLSQDSFYRCSNLITINNFPSTYTSLTRLAFENCTKLRTMIPLPVGCTEVPINAFCGCNSMAGEYIIPATVTSIGEYAFARTDSFTGVKIYATTPPTLDVHQLGSVFSNASSNNNPAVGYPIYVPQSALATYQADTKWSLFGSRLQGFTP